MASDPSSNAEKQIHEPTISAATATSSNTSHSPAGIDLNIPTDVAPSPTPIISPPVVPSTDSSGDSPDSATDEASGSTSKKKGRGKVEMKKMEKESNLLVTFSKRRSGLFKKANELCTLCGVQCAVVVFSPARKVFSFGHPSVDSVVDRYLTGNLINPVPLHGDQMPQNQVEGDHPQGADIENLTAELTDLMEAFHVAKKNSQSLDKKRQERQAKHWMGRPVQEMDLAQLDALKRAMMNLKLKAYEHVVMLTNTSTSGSSSSPSNSIFQWFHQNYPNVHGNFSGFPSWSNNNDPNEAGPSDRSNVVKGGEGSSSGAM